MKTQFSPSLPLSTLALRLGMCAVALASVVAPMSDANATVVSFTTPITVANTFDGTYINLLTGATGATGAATPGWDFDPYNSGTSLSFFWSATPSQASGVASTTTGPYVDLAVGSVISSASTFAQVTATANTAPFQVVGNHILGFRFYNETTAVINYGYMRITTGGTTGFPMTITGWSFENSGLGITVAAVPEPATNAMFAIGALALGALKLRRARRQTAA